MNRVERIQAILNFCYELHKGNLPITLDAIYKKLDSKIPKTTLSKDMQFIHSFIEPVGKRWILTNKGIEASKNGDIFQPAR